MHLADAKLFFLPNLAATTIKRERCHSGWPVAYPQSLHGPKLNAATICVEAKYCLQDFGKPGHRFTGNASILTSARCSSTHRALAAAALMSASMAGGVDEESPASGTGCNKKDGQTDIDMSVS